MLSRLVSELGQLMRYALDDTKRTARLCVLLLVLALAVGYACGMYARVRG